MSVQTIDQHYNQLSPSNSFFSSSHNNHHDHPPRVDSADIRCRTESTGAVISTERSSLSPPAVNLEPPQHEHRRSYSLTPEPSTESVTRGLLSPHRRPKIKRRETVDTSTITKEEHEDYSIVNQYKVVDIIGHGSYGIVHKATDSQNGNTYAMKIVGKRKMMRKKFPIRRPKGGGPAPDPLADIRKEIAILKKLDHANVVKLVEVLEDSNEDELILVFEFITNGPVMEDITVENAIAEDDARDYFIDLILGLEYLHYCKVIHRDIKPENLLLDENKTLKIADFGVSEHWTSDEADASLQKSAGTPAFLAPEAIDGSGSSFGGKALDIWAAGVTLYCMIYGRVPFTGRTITELHEKIQTQELRFYEDTPISSDLTDLLTRLTEKDPTKRITMPQIKQHPWFIKTSRPIPSTEENCRGGNIDLTDQDIEEAVKEFQTPIHILVMIKNMAKKKSLRNPYGIKDSPSVSPCVSPREVRRPSPKRSPSQAEKQKLFASTKAIPTISISGEDSAIMDPNDSS